jgi:hypothetical protein
MLSFTVQWHKKIGTLAASYGISIYSQKQRTSYGRSLVVAAGFDDGGVFVCK